MAKNRKWRYLLTGGFVTLLIGSFLPIWPSCDRFGMMKPIWDALAPSADWMNPRQFGFHCIAGLILRAAALTFAGVLIGIGCSRPSRSSQQEKPN